MNTSSNRCKCSTTFVSVSSNLELSASSSPESASPSSPPSINCISYQYQKVKWVIANQFWMDYLTLTIILLLNRWGTYTYCWSWKINDISLIFQCYTIYCNYISLKSETNGFPDLFNVFLILSCEPTGSKFFV